MAFIPQCKDFHSTLKSLQICHSPSFRRYSSIRVDFSPSSNPNQLILMASLNVFGHQAIGPLKESMQ